MVTAVEHFKDDQKQVFRINSDDSFDISINTQRVREWLVYHHDDDAMRLLVNCTNLRGEYQTHHIASTTIGCVVVACEESMTS